MGQFFIRKNTKAGVGGVVGRGSFGKSPDFLRNLFVKPSLINFPSTKISFFGPYCAISETLQNFNIFLELFHFGTAELICQNKVLGVVGGVLGWNTLLIFQSLF